MRTFVTTFREANNFIWAPISWLAWEANSRPKNSHGANTREINHLRRIIRVKVGKGGFEAGKAGPFAHLLPAFSHLGTLHSPPFPASARFRMAGAARCADFSLQFAPFPPVHVSSLKPLVGHGRDIRLGGICLILTSDSCLLATRCSFHASSVALLSRTGPKLAHHFPLSNPGGSFLRSADF